MSRASIAIITCRRPLWLKRLLLALLKQEVDPSLELDIIVVDNALDEASQRTVEALASQSPFTLHYHTEATPGIVAARNKCSEVFLNSDSDYLLFIDDDEWPQQNNWAQSLVSFAQEQPSDIVTSHVISVGEEGTPDWAVDLIYGHNPYQHGQAIPDPDFYTNNLLISRRVLEQLNPPFDPRFAMTGSSDYHFAVRCINAGFSAHYVDAPVIEEFPKSRATIKWFARRGFRSGVGYTRSHIFEEGFLRSCRRCLPKALLRVWRALSLLARGVIKDNKLLRVEGLFRLCSAIGTVAGFLGIKYDEYKTTHGQ